MPFDIAHGESYRCVALSTAHLTPNDVAELSALCGSNPMIMARDTGWFVKLYEEVESNVRPELSDTYNAIISAAVAAGFRLVEFDADATVIDGLPEHE